MVREEGKRQTERGGGVVEEDRRYGLTQSALAASTRSVFQAIGPMLRTNEGPAPRAG